MVENVQEKKALARVELNEILEYSHDIISNLPDDALAELLDGTDSDIDALVLDIMKAVNEITMLDCHSYKYFKGLANFERAFDDGMKRLSYNYFKTTMLPGFTQGWRNIEWGNIIQLYPWSCILASRGHGKSFETCYSFPLWRLWRYTRPNYLQKETLDNKNSKEVVMITNESKLARRHIGLINEEIRMNEQLKEKLLPHTLSDLGKDKIKTKNGASLEFRTYGGFIRGLHVGTVIVDDFLDESCLYSKDQRDKFHEIFYGAIKSIVEPKGYLIVSGTPYHEEDLYQQLKKDHMFKVFEYPALFPNGELLAPDRFPYESIMDLKKSLGTIVFTREYLVTPVSDSSSLFPWEYLNRAFNEMENIEFAENIDSFPIKMERVVIGCDFAISGNIGADFSVFSVWGRSNGKYYLINYWRKQGAGHKEQVDVICRLNQYYRANKIVAENNGFQSIIINLVKERGVKNIEEFTTTAKIKKNSYDGLPSLSAMFERGEIKIPCAEGETKDKAMQVCGEFNSITFREENSKLESASGKDDTVMSSFFALTDLREKKQGLKVSYL